MKVPKIVCPGCAHEFVAPDGTVGKKIECPDCLIRFEAPNADSADVRPGKSAAAVAHNEGSCPLCRQSKHMSKAQSLYGHLVCKKCFYDFATRRQGAFWLDGILLYPFMVVVWTCFIASSRAFGLSQDTMEQGETLLSFAPYVFFLAKDGLGGYSPGKWLCGARVTNGTTGHPGGFFTSFLRNLPLFIPFMPLLVALELKKGYRCGDRWAKSKVIWTRYADNPVFAPRGRLRNSQAELAPNAS